MDLMKNYVIVITGQEVPALSLSFTIGSPALAREYAVKTSKVIANSKYGHFALFCIDGEDQALLGEWTVVFSPDLKIVK